MTSAKGSNPDVRTVLPALPPYPPLPRFLFGASSSPELPEFPKTMREGEDVFTTFFQGTRGIYSLMRTRRTVDELLRKPTELFPFGEGVE